MPTYFLKLTTSLLLAILFFPSARAAVGPGGTGGGRSVVCRNSKGQIKSAELLDLWEARTLYNRKVVESRAPVGKQVALAVTGLQNAFYFDGSGKEKKTSAESFREAIRQTIEFFAKPSPYVRRLHGIKLSDTADSNEPAVPASCKVEQVVSFMDAPTEPIILINQDIYEKLSATQQAALIVHESLYTFLRMYGESNSIRVRRAVGHVFAGGNFPNQDALLRARHIDCGTTTSPYSLISIFAKPDGSLGIVQRINQNLLMIGVYEPYPEAQTQAQLTKDFEGSLDFILSEDSCRHVPAEQSDDYRFYILPGQGPSDFQSQSIIAARCNQGRVQFNIGGANRKAEPMTCKMVEP